MKDVTMTFRKLAIDGATLVAALSLAMGGMWGLSVIGASLFTLVLFVAVMFPALFSSAVYFGRDVQDATHTLIA